MNLTYTHGREFWRHVAPFVENRDPAGLISYVRKHWPAETLGRLLTCGHDDAVKGALVCLALAGTMADTPAIARQLHDDDAYIAALAEHALWSIWFRVGGSDANETLSRAVECVSENRLDEAIFLLTELISRTPSFAEAHNQLAIAYFLNDDSQSAIKHCKQALALNSCHFGAMAGLGHCYASMARMDLALEAYYDALQMHPRLEGIRQSIRRVRAKARQQHHSGDSRTPKPL